MTAAKSVLICGALLVILACPGFAADDDNEKWLWVDVGQLTFDVEGTGDETLTIHWPGGSSGVTIGRGYDMRWRSKAQVFEALTAAGVPNASAEKLADGAGLDGPEAKAFVEAYKAESWATITRKQQHHLFTAVFSTYVQAARDGVNSATRWGIRFDDGSIKMYPEHSPTLFDDLPPAVIDVAAAIAYNVGSGAFDDENWGGIFQMDTPQEMAAYIGGNIRGSILDAGGRDTGWRAENRLGNWRTQVLARADTLVRELRSVPELDSSVSATPDLEARITTLIELGVPRPPTYLMTVEGFAERVQHVWRDVTDWFTKTDLTALYDKLYFMCVEYSQLAFIALVDARSALQAGLGERAEELYRRYEIYSQASQDADRGALEVFNAQAEIGIQIAEAIRDGCEAAVRGGVRILAPSAAPVVDRLYYSFDFAVDSYVYGLCEAAKRLVVGRVVDGLFNHIRLPSFGGRTLSDAIQNRIGAEAFPIMSAYVSSGEARWYVYRILKEAGGSFVEHEVADLIDEVIARAAEALPSRTSSDEDSTVGTPLPGSIEVTVQLHTTGPEHMAIEGADVQAQDGWRRFYEGSTNPDGAVTFTGSPGTWRFTAWKEGCHAVSWSDDIAASKITSASLNPPSSVISPLAGLVTLTLYVHEGSSSGPKLSGARVAGDDGAGNHFDKSTNSSGYVAITGQPGSWHFAVSKSGYQSNIWDQSITTTCTKHAHLQPLPNQAPTCSLSASPRSGSAPLTVTFSMSASDPDGSVCAWLLDVDGDGDADFSGNSAPPSTRSYTYALPGDYSARLVVSDDDGAPGLDTEMVTVGSEHQPPSCSLSASPRSGSAPLTVTFSMSASDPDGVVSPWVLNPGDGSPSYSGSGAPPSTKTHTYNASGTYTAILMVSDNDDATASDAETIVVTSADVTLTLYVHEGSSSGPKLSGARVAGHDGAGNHFDKSTNSSGYVAITGQPGSWHFAVSKSGYQSNIWDQNTTSSTTRHAYIWR
jgi:PKD repeat protein